MIPLSKESFKAQDVFQGEGRSLPCSSQLCQSLRALPAGQANATYVPCVSPASSCPGHLLGLLGLQQSAGLAAIVLHFWPLDPLGPGSVQLKSKASP